MTKSESLRSDPFSASISECLLYMANEGEIQGKELSRVKTQLLILPKLLAWVNRPQRAEAFWRFNAKSDGALNTDHPELVNR